MGLKTKDLDIVYCLKERDKYEEFKYSLRSLKNLPHGKIWVYGGCPDWLNLDLVEHVSVEQDKGNKWLNVADMLLQIAENDNITEDFIWFNDDFFVLQETDKLDYCYDRTLQIRAMDFYALGWQRMNTRYSRRLLGASRALKSRGKDILNYELHLPIVFNRQSLKQVIEKYPGIGAKRSLYGNEYCLGGIKRKDVKIYNLEDKPDKTWDFVSTSDSSFSQGAVGKYLRNKFRRKSEYEQ